MRDESQQSDIPQSETVQIITDTNSEAPAEAQTAGEQQGFQIQPWLEMMRIVATYYRLPISAESARLAVAWDSHTNEYDKISYLARRMHLQVKYQDPAEIQLSSWQLPVIVQLKSGQIGVVMKLSSSGEAGICFAGDGGLQSPAEASQLLQDAEVVVIARPARAIPDARVDAYNSPYDKNWFRKIVLRDIRPYGHILLASLIANTLGLAGIIFSMQVYDRVVPSQSYHTLYVLFCGVLLAIGIDFVMRRTRMAIIDHLGKRSDIRVSDRVFGHALRVQNSSRPTSTGTFISQIRDLEQVRELLTSTTVSALADIPFFLLFLVIYWFMGGVLVLIPLGALFFLLIPGLLAQPKLRKYASASMREASLRNAMLVETVQGIEDIKTLQAEERFQQQWNHYNSVTGEAQLRLRHVTNMLTVWTHNVQTGVFAVVVFTGAPMVIAGDMTTGALVACSVLGSRMMAPMAHITQVLSRLQQAKVGLVSLNTIMKMPIDYPENENRIQTPYIKGSYSFKTALYRYGDENSPPALLLRNLNIKAGEKIAVLGKNGSGKSTLLQAMSGLMQAKSGEVLLDDLAMNHIDPADIRRDVGLLTQNARLFHGTLMENIIMGAPQAEPAQILPALKMVGADEFIRKLPKGLDHIVLEGGLGLSGGQKQSLLLARLLIRNPSVLLLDEPTAAMDEATERHFIDNLRKYSGEKTLVIATHRMRALDLVDRIIVVESGVIALDEQKETALKILKGLANVPPPARTMSQAS